MISDSINQAILANALDPLCKNIQIYALDSCDSTNTFARELALAGTEKAIIVANHQTAGRGRMGRQFHSPADVGIYLSILHPIQGDLSASLGITCAASVSVMRAIRRKTNLQAEIKWVNDLLLDGKKVCGILTEAMTLGQKKWLIVGIGINLRPSVFPKELAEIAGSLNQSTLPRIDLIAEIVKELLPYLNDPKSNSWIEEYRRYSCVIGKEILRIENGISTPCRAESIDDRGRLTVRHANGDLEILQSGEISIRTTET